MGTEMYDGCSTTGAAVVERGGAGIVGVAVEQAVAIVASIIAHIVPRTSRIIVRPSSFIRKRKTRVEDRGFSKPHSPVTPAPEPGSSFFLRWSGETSWTPDQVRGDGPFKPPSTA